MRMRIPRTDTVRHACTSIYVSQQAPWEVDGQLEADD